MATWISVSRVVRVTVAERMASPIAAVGGGATANARARGGLTPAEGAFTNASMTDDVHDSLIPYDEIVQDALRAVVGRVLRQVESDGLPGNHHFYITYKTHAPGVVIPRALTERFPDEMTIVLQNRYWDLKIADDHFSVGLSFNQVPSTLIVPYSAITAFVDPSVDFGLQFHVSDTEAGPEPHDAAGNDAPVAVPVEDGSNVVSVDFGKKR